MTAELVSELERPQHRTIRARFIGAVGPTTVFAGVIWAIAQPHRVTLLHPHGQTFWWLVVEPPVLVVLVGLLFALVIAPGVLEDLDATSG